MHDDGHFDARVAATYDADSGNDQPEDIDPVVDHLAALTGNGAALEFAIGTGRIALPLAARGVPVHGIELSQAMVDKLHEKPGGADIPVTIGDMTSTRVDAPFNLVYLVFNTIMNLTTQAAQVACFRNAAAHLAPGGHFVVEVMVPNLRQLPEGGTHVPFHISDAHWGVDEYDVVEQGLVSHHLFFRGERTERWSMPFRYVWPAELDLMAELAGMQPVNRNADWAGTPFTAKSTGHVSVWRKP